MKYRLIILNHFLILFVIIGCSKKENFITDLITIDTLYTRADKILPDWQYSNKIKVYIAGKDTILGYYTEGSNPFWSTVFYSWDGFKTIHYNELPGDFYVSYLKDKNIIVQRRVGSSSDFGGFEARISNDNGFSFNNEVKVPGKYWEYLPSFPAFNSKGEGIFFIRNTFLWVYKTDSIEVFKIKNNSHEKISRIILSLPYSISPIMLSFIDDDNLFFVGYAGDNAINPSYIFHSSDRGLTWKYKLVESLPPIRYYYTYIDEVPNSNIAIISKNKYVFYFTKSTSDKVLDEYQDYVEVYYSYDSGVNWVLKDFNISGYIKSIQFVDDKTGYMLVATLDTSNHSKYLKKVIYKSADSGETWKIIGPEIYANTISFDSEGNGIAIANRIVQTTNDGGLTWKLLTYYDENSFK